LFQNNHLAASFGTDQVSRHVRWAQKCDSAEQLGERIKRLYDRSLRRRGLAPAGNARAEAELDRIIGEVYRDRPTSSQRDMGTGRGDPV
jgi:hypothetical protein